MSALTKGQTPHTTPSNKLEDQAASAALYVTKNQSATTSTSSVLDENGRLSSASAATSLKYARPQDLPSFPSSGLKLSSAGAAASLAESNQKSFEHWKPGSIPAANKAAMVAKDYEMDPLWQPTGSDAGSSAATQALRSKPPGAITEREVGADSRRKALMAATGAMASGRQRAGSAPIKPAPKNDDGWALKAALGSQRGQKQNDAYFGKGDPGFEASRIQNMAKSNVNRQMYGSAPPVQLEVDEKNRQAMLRASAVAMAQKMYAIQQSHIDEAKVGDSRAAAVHMHRRNLSSASDDMEEPQVKTPHKYANLEEAARKLAQERLAKIHDEHAEYRSYYGTGPAAPKSRLSMRGRRRASSDGQADDLDEEQSRKIRSQMSIFQSKLAAVDNQKKQGDRDALMATAQKNVAARMSTMDEKVFQETGKASPAQMEQWEKEARAKAQADSDDRMINHGKVHIGSGKYLDQAEVDAIARTRLQPTLDQISDEAEKKRARDEEIRVEQEKQKRDAEIEKQRQAEVKVEAKKTRDAEAAEAKAKRDAEAAEAKAKRDTEAAEAKAKRDTEKAEEKAKRDAEAAELKAKKDAEKQEAQARKQEQDAIAAEEKRKQREQKAAEDSKKFAEKQKQKEEAAAEKERQRASKEENRKPKDGKTRRFGAFLGGIGAGGAVATAAATEGAALPSVEGTRAADETAIEPEAIEPAAAEPTATEGATEPIAEPLETVGSDESTGVHYLTTIPQPEEAEALDEPEQGIDVEPEHDADVVEPSVPQASTMAEGPMATKSSSLYPPETPAAPTSTEPMPEPTTSTSNERTVEPTSPTKGEKGNSKVKSWFKTRFRTGSKSQKEIEGADGRKSGFIGGAALTGAGTNGSDSLDLAKSDSMREVAMAGKTDGAEDMYGSSEKDVSPVQEPVRGRSHSPSISSLSESDVDEDSTQPSRGRRGFKERLLNKSNTKESNDKDEDFEEARDTFNEEKLTPPPKISTIAADSTKSENSPSRERSKFTENL